MPPAHTKDNRLPAERIALIKGFESKYSLPKQYDGQNLALEELAKKFTTLHPNASQDEVKFAIEILARRAAVKEVFPRVPDAKVDTIKLSDEAEAKVQAQLKAFFGPEAAGVSPTQLVLPIRDGKTGEKKSPQATQAKTVLPIRAMDKKNETPQGAQGESPAPMQRFNLTYRIFSSLGIKGTSADILLDPHSILGIKITTEAAGAVIFKMVLTSARNVGDDDESPPPGLTAEILVGKFHSWLKLSHSVGKYPDLTTKTIDIINDVMMAILRKVNRVEEDERTFQDAVYKVCKLVLSKSNLEKVPQPPKSKGKGNVLLGSSIKIPDRLSAKGAKTLKVAKLAKLLVPGVNSISSPNFANAESIERFIEQIQSALDASFPTQSGWQRPKEDPLSHLTTEGIIELFSKKWKEQFDCIDSSVIDTKCLHLYKALADARKNPHPVSPEMLTAEDKLRRAWGKLITIWNGEMVSEAAKNSLDETAVPSQSPESTSTTSTLNEEDSRDLAQAIAYFVGYAKKHPINPEDLKSVMEYTMRVHFLKYSTSGILSRDESPMSRLQLQHVIKQFVPIDLPLLDDIESMEKYLEQTAVSESDPFPHMIHEELMTRLLTISEKWLKEGDGPDALIEYYLEATTHTMGMALLLAGAEALGNQQSVSEDRIKCAWAKLYSLFIKHENIEQKARADILEESWAAAKAKANASGKMDLTQERQKALLEFLRSLLMLAVTNTAISDPISEAVNCFAPFAAIRGEDAKITENFVKVMLPVVGASKEAELRGAWAKFVSAMTAANAKEG